MLIVLVEDDHLQADWMIPHLNERLTDVKIHHIKTESAFRAWLQSEMTELPTVFVIDEMLRWADRARLKDGVLIETTPPPPEHADPQRAGKRIIDLLGAHPRLAKVPIVLYTVLESLDLRYLGLPAYVKTVSKNMPADELISAVTTAAAARSNR